MCVCVYLCKKERLKEIEKTYLCKDMHLRHSAWGCVIMTVRPLICVYKARGCVHVYYNICIVCMQVFWANTSPSSCIAISTHKCILTPWPVIIHPALCIQPMVLPNVSHCICKLLIFIVSAHGSNVTVKLRRRSWICQIRCGLMRVGHTYFQSLC